MIENSALPGSDHGSDIAGGFADGGPRALCDCGAHGAPQGVADALGGTFKVRTTQ
jgi:hypothetical protein